LVFGSVFFNFFNLLRNKNNLAAERFRSAEHSLGNPALKPWVHYVPVSRSLGEAKELIEFALANDDVAKQIAKR
jgi:hypothetical protein